MLAGLNSWVPKLGNPIGKERTMCMARTLRIPTHLSLAALAALVTITCLTHPNVSRAARDGKIAFVSDRARPAPGMSSNQIYTMNPDGSQVRPITAMGSGASDPAFSPDGKRVAFSSYVGGNYELFVINATGRRLQRLTRTQGLHERDPAWSPSGKEIAYSATESREEKAAAEIYAMDAKGGEPRQVTSNDRGNADYAPAWSPTGLGLAYEHRAQIYYVQTDGSSPAQVESNGIARSPAFSPDGKWIAYDSNELGYGNNAIFLMRADGSEKTLLTELKGTEAAPAWAPGGERIAFHANTGGKYQIYTVTRDGGGLQQLTHNANGEVGDRDPTWALARKEMRK